MKNDGTKSSAKQSASIQAGRSRGSTASRSTSAGATSPKSSRKRVGRPKAEGRGEDVRATLIETAQRLFAEKGYGEVSLRELAKAADVTPAMISYYFGDKAGLYEAVFTETLDTLLARLKTAAAEHQAVGARARSKDVPLDRLLKVYFKTILEQPWLPQLILREVASRDTHLREVFVERFAGEATTLLPNVIAHEMMAGHIRADMDPRHLLMSLLGMIVFPILIEPVLGPLLGYKLDEAFAAERIDHIRHLFFEGASPRPKEPPRAGPKGPRIRSL